MDGGGFGTATVSFLGMLGNNGRWFCWDGSSTRRLRVVSADAHAHYLLHAWMKRRIWGAGLLGVLTWGRLDVSNIRRACVHIHMLPMKAAGGEWRQRRAVKAPGDSVVEVEAVVWAAARSN